MEVALNILIYNILIQHTKLIKHDSIYQKNTLSERGLTGAITILLVNFMNAMKLSHDAT